MPQVRFDRAAIARASALVGVATAITVMARVPVKSLDAFTIDDFVVRVALVAAGFAVLFYFGVKQLRQAQAHGSLAYTALGVASCVPPFLLA
ncbi:MAG: hypothetical protein ACKOOL_02850, partial [Novosphingobium sp.]